MPVGTQLEGDPDMWLNHDEFPSPLGEFVMVMKRADRNLAQIAKMERVAGLDFAMVCDPNYLAARVV